jgi:NAD(P)-dependent dehydrogenase (short-subunit alcohol dehydrogenase family)
MTVFPGVALVTGAAGTGIGAATAKGFAQEGCRRIAITDINAELLEKTKQAIISASSSQTDVYAEAGDISKEDFVDSFVQNVVKYFGQIDYAVNCAGVLGEDLRSHEVTSQQFDRINGINYRGCWLSSRAELRQMMGQELVKDSDRPPQRGAIVNIASQLGIVGRPTAGEYARPALCSCLLWFCSTVLCLESSSHIHDALRCDRLLEGQHSNQLYLSRSH